jgi:transposase
MFIDWTRVKVYIKPGFTDFRKQINGLGIIVQQEMKLNPFSDGLFIFCNKRKNRIKVLYWDKTGFCLWLKRLEKARFPWPLNKEEVMEINVQRFQMLLCGIDFFKVHEELKYSEII